MASKYAKPSSRSIKRTRSRHTTQQEDNFSDGNTSDVEIINHKPAQPLALYSGINKVNHISDHKDENSFLSSPPFVSSPPLKLLGAENESLSSSSSSSLSQFEQRKRKRLSSVLFTQPTILKSLTDPHICLTPEQSALNYLISNLESPTAALQVPLMSCVWPSNFSSDHILSNMDYLLANHVNETIKEFANLEGKISLLLKMFTVFDENGERVSFLAIIATWLDEKLEFKELLLDFSLCKASDKNNDSFIYQVARSVFESLEEYGFLQKVFVITYDYQNIEVDRKAFTRTLAEFYNGQAPNIVVTYSLASAISRIAANFLHNLRIEAWPLAKQYEYNAHPKLQSLDPNNEWRCIDCIRCVLLYYSESSAKKSDWLSLCVNQKLNDVAMTSILLDNPSDWLSTYQMLSNSLFLRKAFNQATMHDDLEDYSIDDNEWERIEELVKLLHILKNFTKLLETQQPLINLSALTMWKIKDVLLDIKTLKGPFANFRIELCKTFEMAFQEHEKWILTESQWPEKIFQFASMLDPRQVCTELSNHCRNEEIKFVMKKFEEFIFQYESGTHDEKSQFQTKKHDLRDPFNGQLILGNPTTTKANQAPIYLSRIPIRYKDLEESESMLIWWQSNKLSYPHHFSAARDLFGASGSVEGAVERLFGKGFESLLRTQWKTVSPDILRKLVILRAKSHFK